jgi:D-3-phosphoglycerate dehydrogenase
MSYIVVLADPIHEQGIVILEQIATVRQANQDGLPLADQLRDVHAIVTRLTKVTPELIDAAPSLRAISRHGVGVDSVDVTYATSRGIPVLYTPAANAESVAEHTLGMMLAVSKMILLGDRAQRNGDFQSRTRLIGFELYGKTLGIVGAGRVGSRVARMCRAALDMHVIAYDPFLSADDARLRGVELVPDLSILLQEADYVSLHAPLTPETQALIGPRELNLMKPTAILVNCARGGIVDEEALATALLEGQIAGAAVDVWQQEPPLQDHPLFALENVIVSPHMAAHTEEAMIRMATTLALDITRVLQGERPHFCVNPRVFS